ncbi:hypothetical protein QZH41_013760 [Actinostola sp. cb2023]|nr:hypothetical protein QZH41_013760 [Actinostola sp. cb2023]
MEKRVLVPNRLQHIGRRNKTVELSHQDDVQDVEGLHDFFHKFKNIKSQLTTGHRLELGKDFNPNKKHRQEINKLLLLVSELAKDVSTEFKDYNLIF